MLAPLQKAEEHHAVVLLDSDMVSVDVWQLANWPVRWLRAVEQMQVRGGVQHSTCATDACWARPGGAAEHRRQHSLEAGGSILLLNGHTC